MINGSEYIGKQESESTWYLGSGKILLKAIKKYGRNNFKKYTLAETNDKEFLNHLEKYYIKWYKENDNVRLYNIAEGGNGGKTCSQEKRKVPVYQFDLKGNFIKKWKSATDAAKELNINRIKIITACKKEFSSFNFMWSKDRNYIPLHRDKTCNKKRVYKFNINNQLVKEYDSVIEACKDNNISKDIFYNNVEKIINNYYFSKNNNGLSNIFKEKL